MILKVQLPLASTEINPPALVYNEDQSIYLHLPVENVSARMRGRPKVYFYATERDGDLYLDDEAPEQLW